LPTDRFSLVTDASGCSLGAVLQVERDGEWAPAAFFSRQTRGPERRYSASELEALAVVESIKHFSPYLYGRSFVVFTDHKPLCSLLTSDHLNGRLKRFSTKLQPWMVTFQYLPGMENTLADALSRQDWVIRDAAFVLEDGDKDIPDQKEQSRVLPVAQDVPQASSGGCGGQAPQNIEIEKIQREKI